MKALPGQKPPQPKPEEVNPKKEEKKEKKKTPSDEDFFKAFGF